MASLTRSTKLSYPEMSEIAWRENNDILLEESGHVEYAVHHESVVKDDASDGKIVWTLRSSVAAVSLCALYVGSQAPLYFVGGFLSFMGKGLGASDKQSWLPVSNTLAIAAITPFVGYLQDIVGRRHIALFGCLILMVGCVFAATATHFGQAVTGMAMAGAGAGIGELTALAGISEVVPVKKRALYVAIVTASILPLTPVILYAQLLATYRTWRWGLWICLIINGTAGLGLTFTYFPGSRTNGLTKMEILKKIDYVGGFLSVVGLTLFLVALQSGGYSHPWKGAYVLCTLIIGLTLVVAFIIWEWKVAVHPLVPKEIFAGQRIVALAFAIAFVSGMNFYSYTNFGPLLFETVFNPAPVTVGLKGLASALGTTVGAVVTNSLLSILKGHNRELLLFAAVIMTVFIGSLAAVNPDREVIATVLSTIASYGVGGVLVPAATVALTVTPDAFIATTVALSISIRVIGGSIGFTIFYNVFISRLTTLLPLNVATYAIRAGLPLPSAQLFVEAYLLDPKESSKLKGVTPAILEAAALGSRWAYSDSLAYVWYTSIAFGVLAIVACLFLGNIRRYMTNRIAVDLSHMH